MLLPVSLLAPRFRRATSAVEFSHWLTGVESVLARDVVSVRSASEPGRGSRPVHVVTVVTSSRTRVLRSPDRTLPELLLPFDPAAGRPGD